MEMFPRWPFIAMGKVVGVVQRWQRAPRVRRQLVEQCGDDWLSSAASGASKMAVGMCVAFKKRRGGTAVAR